MTTPSSSLTGHRGSRQPFAWLGWDWLHLVALAGFVGAYFLVERDPSFAPISVLALLACVIARLDEEKRRTAVIPLTLSALMLAGRVGVYAASTSSRWPRDVEQPGIGWLPLFFAACIFLAPELGNYTGKVMMSMSLLLLTSGLLPGDAFEFIFLTCQYFLFLALMAGLGLDFTRNLVAAKEAQHKTM